MEKKEKLLQVKIDEELLKEFKIKLLKEDRKIKEVIEKLVKMYINDEVWLEEEIPF
jgi:nitrogen regulatory protein PII